MLVATKYASRRGAAYGLAGVIEGARIRGTKNSTSSIVFKPQQKTKNDTSHAAVPVCIRDLSNTLSQNFEPYLTYALLLLVMSFGGLTADVCEAPQDASCVIMGNISGYGVKLILPILLEGLDEKQCRSKKGSTELLGMMAYRSPRQLSISLPIMINWCIDRLSCSNPYLGKQEFQTVRRSHQ